MKKIIIITLILTAIITSLTLVISGQKSSPIIPEKTGGFVTPPSSQEVSEAKAINSLQKNLPLTADKFVILEYDYGRGKFIINTDSEVDFENWLTTSSYSAIPKSMFLIQ